MDSTMDNSNNILMECCTYTLTQITAASTNIALSFHSSSHDEQSSTVKQSPLLAAIHAGYLPGPSTKPLKEAFSQPKGLKRSHAKQKHISKVNIGLFALPTGSRKSRVKGAKHI